MPAPIERRAFLVSVPALLMAPKAFAQPKPTLKVRGFNHVTLVVSDLKQSVDFYQGLFGLAKERTNRTADASLRIGPGHGLDLTTDRPDRTPRIDHYCYGVENFSVNNVLKTLAAHGIEKSEGPGQPGPLKVLYSTAQQRVMVGDPDGILFQLQDPTYCGGGGPLGNQCGAPDPSPKKGLIALKGYSHVTVFSPDPARSTTFYRDLFGSGIRSFQGPTAPTVAIGPGVEFAMYTGGGGGRAGAPPRPASINHFSFSMDGFDAETVTKTLESYGITPREGQTGPVGPMRHYISMRMENRGGAKEGTPELYFTDPDGILVQIQDTSYCGGSGVLGNVCPPVSG
jgi:catechol 2,3-dioxygenase-like lactoylglutathione lyase family enzyme